MAVAVQIFCMRLNFEVCRMQRYPWCRFDIPQPQTVTCNVPRLVGLASSDKASMTSIMTDDCLLRDGGLIR